VQNAELALGLVHDAVVIMVDGHIHFAGPSRDAPPIHLLPQPVTVQSGRGLLVTPGLCDPHTHLLWAGERSHEFDQRNLGASYQQIAAQRAEESPRQCGPRRSPAMKR
jgi:imidazolonepropionase